MKLRALRKAESRRRIVAAAARRLRAEGADGAGVAEVMAEAGLTHGGFYAHFPGREALLAEALAQALAVGRDRWFGGLDGAEGRDVVAAVLGRYLNPRHRAALDDGCAFAALASDFARAGPPLRRAATEGLEAAAALLAPGAGGRGPALALIALCVGGLALARGVDDPALSDEVLRACRRLGLSRRDGQEDGDGGTDLGG
jgi:TetR/AcrR family transcriptional repressor of nem operon